ncbi:hypothetical protein M2419_002865 [Sphingobacterium sp. BIGb0116]|nr:hypothetical protein [Sphingobacterium sp. BIGb0116]
MIFVYTKVTKFFVSPQCANKEFELLKHKAWN